MDKYDTVKEAATKYCIGINTIFFALDGKDFFGCRHHGER